MIRFIANHTENRFALKIPIPDRDPARMTPTKPGLPFAGDTRQNTSELRFQVTA